MLPLSPTLVVITLLDRSSLETSHVFDFPNVFYSDDESGSVMKTKKILQPMVFLHLQQQQWSFKGYSKKQKEEISHRRHQFMRLST